MQWMDYLSRFNFDITYIKGENNKVADCLSRYYENDTWEDTHSINKYVQADAHIDPNGDDLPPSQLQEVWDKVMEICAMQETQHRHSHWLQEKKELRKIEAQELAETTWWEPNITLDKSKDYTLADTLQSGPDLDQVHKNDDAFARAV
ncbi:hypothetical protein IW262DRAFT_1465747 [Armillaria fumosa]|nr:hypothetical protein IW262DRAFT_1465747 [Armillaria fumosa]